ncbi:TonB family protein [Limimaricola sp. G21655-S1]|uniref:energy transducer TonB n=1 Tax=Limimaricola sp. G21655-S1 TaxID=3014768 RepID=UPI0022AF779F|nr:energy transducer TonB [Limimaricola sp. G21655-S1]MCZ4260666.1 TonB family protein [Limimaricola sp. G21655-S1]
MRRLLEGASFLALAVGAHLALLALRPDEGTPTAAGASGAETVTLAAADAQIAALVDAWERPSETGEIAQPMPIAPPVPQMPKMPAPAAPVAPAMPTGPGLAVPQAPELPAAPEIDTISAEPLPSEPQQPMTEPPKDRPQPRPERPPELAPKPEPKPELTPQREPQRQASEPRQAQRAAGSGGGAQAGAAQQQAAPGLSPGQVQSLTAQWGAQLRSQIERRKRYPNAARGASGQVTVRITVDRRGRLTGLALVGSSGNAVLDQAALNAVQAARLPAAPQGLNNPSYSFTLPMLFNG